jgi:PPOX class probable F420-dependent enzyme
MNERDRVAMTEQEVAGLLAGSRKVQLATINRDGTPHLVTMYYAMLDGQIAFWTYRTSQKARNLARDPRLTCLVETGSQYFDLRGVQVQGVARCVEEPEAVRDIGLLITARWGMSPGPAAARWRSTWPTQRASGPRTSWSRGGSVPGTTRSCSDQGCWLLTETTSPVRYEA